VIGFGPEDVARVRPDAAYVAERYAKRFKSVYETSTERVLRGLLAQDLLARSLGREQADVHAPYKTDYDIEPDIEVRATLRPSRPEFWDRVSLQLYPNDRGKLSRRWVLAVVDFERSDVRYLGWQTGPKLLLPRAIQLESRGGRTYWVIGSVYPDQLEAMATLAR
jgi:hypothetical protein